MAGSVGSIRAGRAYVEIGADKRSLTRTLASARKDVDRFASGISAAGRNFAMIGAAIVAPLAGAARMFASVGDEVAKMSKRTGVSIASLSELSYVATQSGSSFATLENAFRKMQRSIYDAGRGLSTQTDALRDLGLTYAQLAILSPEQQFKAMAQAISQVPDATRKAAIAMSLFGRTGTNLLPMFAKGAKGITDLQTKARALGLTITDEAAKAAEDFTDDMDTLWRVIKMSAFEVGSTLAPAIADLAKKMITGAQAAREWAAANKEKIVSFAKLGGALLAAGVSMYVFSKVLKALTATAKALPAILGAVKVGIAGIASAAGAVGGAGLIAALVGAGSGAIIADTLLENRRKLADAQARVNAQLKRNKAILDANKAAAEAHAAAYEKMQNAAGQAAKDLDQIETDIAKRGLSRHQRKIAEISERVEREKALVRTMMLAAINEKDATKRLERTAAVRDRMYRVASRAQAEILALSNAETTDSSLAATRAHAEALARAITQRMDVTGEDRLTALWKRRYERFAKRLPDKAKKMGLGRFITTASEGAYALDRARQVYEPQDQSRGTFAAITRGAMAAGGARTRTAEDIKKNTDKIVKTAEEIARNTAAPLEFQ